MGTCSVCRTCSSPNQDDLIIEQFSREFSLSFFKPQKRLWELKKFLEKHPFEYGKMPSGISRRDDQDGQKHFLVFKPPSRITPILLMKTVGGPPLGLIA